MSARAERPVCSGPTAEAGAVTEELRSRLHASVVLNGRPLLASSPGIRRYASELQQRLELPVLLPSAPFRSGPAAHVWEQSRLAAAASRRLLFSPGNTGPVLRRRQVVTIHDLAPLDHPEFFTPAFVGWYRLLLAALVRTCRRILVPSAFTARRLLRRFPEAAGRTVVVRHGVDHVLRHAPPPVDGRGDGDDPFAGVPFVLTVGTREPRKNLATVLEAWRLLRRRCGERVRLLVVGGAAPRHVFARADPPHAEDGVVFLGAVGDEHLLRLYRRAAAAVFVPHYEGFGLPVLEAMACGVPVVASDIPVVREIAGDAVVRVDPRSPTEVADALRRILGDDTLRRRLAAAGTARAARFRWDEAARRTAEILLEAT